MTMMTVEEKPDITYRCVCGHVWGYGSAGVRVGVGWGWTFRCRLSTARTCAVNTWVLGVVALLVGAAPLWHNVSNTLLCPLSTPPPSVYSDIGGCKDQIEKMREVVELPMLHPEKFVRLGIDPPKVGRAGWAAGGSCCW